MAEMFRYLTTILENEEKRGWKLLVVFTLLSPVMEVFSFSVMIFIVNTIVQEKQVSIQMIAFTFSMGAISLLKGLFDIYKCKLSTHFLYSGSQKLSMKLFELHIKEELECHNRKSAVQVLTAVREDTERCMDVMITCIEACSGIFVMTGYFVLMIYVKKWIGLFSSILLVLFMMCMFYRYRRQMKAYGEERRLYVTRANAQVTIAYGMFKEMKIDDKADTILRRYQDASRGYARVQEKYRYKNSIIRMAMQNLVMAVAFVVFASFLWCLKENMIFTIASMAVYIGVLVKAIPTAYEIVKGMNYIEFSRRPYEIVRECLTKYAKMQEREKASENIREKRLTFQKGLSVRNLSFQYNEHTQIFCDASIEIPAGYSVAIIGVSGIGKTTFLDLILGLLEPQAGSIRYDDYDIVTHTDDKGICKARVGDIVSYIPQTIYLNGETIRNNVAFFEEERIDDDKVIECLKCAQVWKDVTQLPEGIHTLIGENGAAISGGQRQRIALAKALYRDFELLIMDEATAALDMETEKAVIDSIRQVKRNKTILIVTHHMSLADECDIVYRIENQKLIRVK